MDFMKLKHQNFYGNFFIAISSSGATDPVPLAPQPVGDSWLQVEASPYAGSLSCMKLAEPPRAYSNAAPSHA